MIYYWSDGPKKREVDYENGKQHGTAIKYREDGSKESEFPYVNGNRHGTEIGYHADGSKRLEIGYENGTKISEKQWDEDGNLVDQSTLNSESDSEKAVEDEKSPC